MDPNLDSVVSLDPDPDSRSRSGSRRAKMSEMTHKNRKKLIKFIFLKFWMFSFEG